MEVGIEIKKEILDDGYCAEMDFQADQELFDLKQKLAAWALRYKISRAALNELLTILRNYGVDLPETAEDLLQLNSEQVLAHQNFSKRPKLMHFLEGDSLDSGTRNRIFHQEDYISALNSMDSSRSSSKAAPFHIKAEIDTFDLVDGAISEQQEIQNISELKSPEIRFIARRLGAIEQTVESIRNAVLLKKSHVVQFPLKSRKEIQETNTKLLLDIDGSYRENLVTILKDCVPVDSSHATTGLVKILTDELIAEYNWDGDKGKHPLRELELFKSVLYDAWYSKYTNYRDYEAGIRKQIADARGRAAQRKFREKIRVCSQNTLH